MVARRGGARGLVGGGGLPAPGHGASARPAAAICTPARRLPRWRVDPRHQASTYMAMSILAP